jgi:pyruvate dehydrogenase E1 component alpha subunit
VEAETVLGPAPADYDLGGLVPPEFRSDWLGGSGQPFQILGENGAADPERVADLSPDTLRAMYQEMLLVRCLEGRTVNLQRQGRIAFCLTASGEEAAVIGSAFALEPDDWVFTAYREIGAALHRGVSLETLFCQFFGNAQDLLKGRQMPNHFGCMAVRYTVASSPVGTQIPHAVGAALAAKLRGENSAVLTYFGDGATSTGDFHAGMNLAGLHRLPVIFFCKNNGWAISLPRERQTASATLAQKAQAYGFDGVRVDGNDVLAVYRVTRSAREKARSGGGPTMIEAVTYRMGPHSSADDPSRYRSDSELAEWRQRDPVERFGRYLAARGLWTADDERRAQQEADRQVAAAVEHAESVPPPAVSSMFDDVYAELPWHLREQRDELAAAQEK